jgi:RNA polymerase sigma-70 factor (ECF subfamily)
MFRSSDRAAAEECFYACYPRLAGWVRRLASDNGVAHGIASEEVTRLLARWCGLESP